jgi:hypothetical protein
MIDYSTQVLYQLVLAVKTKNYINLKLAVLKDGVYIAYRDAAYAESIERLKCPMESGTPPPLLMLEVPLMLKGAE